MNPIDIVRTLADNLLWISLAGAIISTAWNILGYLRFIRYVHSATYAVEILDYGADIYKSRFAPTPKLVGVIKPRIYLPDLEYTDGQLGHILLHELTHLRRRDVWLKWFAVLVVSLHWFNPIAYLMRREFNRACNAYGVVTLKIFLPILNLNFVVNRLGKQWKWQANSLSSACQGEP